jgi:hypothetical protein
MHFPDMAPSIPCSGAKNAYLAPAAGWFQEEWQQRFSITCADFGDIDIVESINREQGESVNLATGFQNKVSPAATSPPLLRINC